MLRAAGRIYLGLGPDPGEEADAPSVEEQEKADRPLWLMLAPCVALLAAAISAPSGSVENLARQFAPLLASTEPESAGTPAPAWLPWLSVALALAICSYSLFLQELPKTITRMIHLALKPIFGALNAMHSGLVGDYVLLMAAGLALLSIALWFN